MPQHSSDSFIELHNWQRENKVEVPKGALMAYFYSDKSDVKILSVMSSPLRLKPTIQKVVESFSGAEIKVKLIGDLKRFKASLENFKKDFFVEKEVSREHSFEIQYFPKQQKLRVSVAEKVRDNKKEDKKLKVLIIDDSKVICNLLTKVFSKFSDRFEVVGATHQPGEIDKIIKANKPDVVTLDLHMPEMDGIDVLKKYLVPQSIPAVIVSAISMEEGPKVLDALSAGAVDYLQKPELSSIQDSVNTIIEKIEAAAGVKTKMVPAKPLRFSGRLTLNTSVPIFIGASTGGTTALEDVLVKLPAEIPPIVIIQHIPPIFSAALATRLDSICKFPVGEAEMGEILRPGKVYVAPGGKQLSFLKTEKGEFRIRLKEGAGGYPFVPSVDCAFNSAASLGIAPSVAVILTGMGADGAEGLSKMRANGTRTIAQDEETCVVFGMPKKAIEIGAAEFVCPLDEIAEKMSMLTMKPAAKKRAAS